jgi:NitT/TauT family transport system ATP-binding protein
MSVLSGSSVVGETSEAASQSLVRLDDIVYSYPSGREVLSGVSLGIQRGEFVSIVGPSGCGKSTLLSLIAGLAEPTSGAIAWAEGMGRSKTRPLFTLVFQKDTLLPWLSVAKNVSFGLRYLDISKEEAAERTNQLLSLVGLNAVRDQFPGRLSGGQRRRVSLLMGIAPLPHVLLLDEPFSALDEPTRIGIHTELLKMTHEMGITTILVTHDIGEAVTLSDRVCVMSAGPSRVASQLRMTFEEPRDMMLIRETPAYQHSYSEVWRDLRMQIEPQVSA